MCLFADEMKPPSALLAERTFNAHPLETYLYTVCVYSQTKHEPQGGEEANAELDGKVQVNGRVWIFFARERVA